MTPTDIKCNMKKPTFSFHSKACLNSNLLWPCSSEDKFLVTSLDWHCRDITMHLVRPCPFVSTRPRNERPVTLDNNNKKKSMLLMSASPHFLCLLKELPDPASSYFFLCQCSRFPGLQRYASRQNGRKALVCIRLLPLETWRTLPHEYLSKSCVATRFTAEIPRPECLALQWTAGRCRY